MAKQTPGERLSRWLGNVKAKLRALFRRNDTNADHDIAQLQEGAGTDTSRALALRQATATRKVGTVTKHVPRIEESQLQQGQQTMLGMMVPRRRPHNGLLAIVFTTAKLVVILLMVLAAAGLGALVGVAQAYMETTPTLDVGRFTDLSQTSFIYDKNGDLITTFVGIEDREWADIDEIPDMLQNAFIAVEDVRFLKHQGVDYKRLFSAVVATFTNTNTHGGSTITQQLIKNSILTNELSYKRKIQEAYLALELEKEYSKSEILEAYLNIIHLGESNYGVKAAAKDYFGKELKDLTIRECAMLAGLTQNPYSYNPRKNMYQRGAFNVTDERTDGVLRRMYSASFITKQQYDNAVSDAEKRSVHIVEVSKIKMMYDMPYFVEYGIQDVITHMLRKEGMQDSKQNRAAMENKLRTGGYRIYLTVDPAIQNEVQNTLATWDKYPAMRDPAYNVKLAKNADGTIIDVPQPQAAAVVLDYHTGELRAIVGGRTPPERKKQLNRAYQASMPVGSSTKPISVYGPALDAGASPASIFENVPVPIDGYGGTKGYPNNFGGNMDKTMGLVTMRTGIKSSLNVVAARALLEWTSVDISKDYLVNLGVDPSHIRATPAGLALGTSGITPIEMSAAFGAIANKGVYLEPLSFSKVVDAKGNVVLDADEIRIQRQVFKPSTCWMLTSMLVDAVKGGTGTQAQIKGMTVAGKTGTNDDYRGVFFSGMTPYYSAAVWIGHDDYSPQLRRGATGGSYAAPLWKAFMTPIHEGLDNKDIIADSPESLGLVKVTVCSVSGKLASEECSLDAGGSKPVTDWFLTGTEPAESCDMHITQHICTASGRMATPYCPEALIQSKSILVIPSSSPLSLLPQETLLSILPNAYLDLPQVNMMPGTVEYELYYCPIHTETWIPSQNAVVTEQTTDAAALSEKVYAFLNNPETVLTESQRMNLLNLLLDLQDWVQQGHAESIAMRVSTLQKAYNEALAAQQYYQALP